MIPPAFLAAGPPPLNSAVITALVVGIPSVIVALAAYALSNRASRETATASHQQIDAGAYTRARELYESAIAELRNQVADLHTEMGRMRAELDTTRAEVTQLRRGSKSQR